MGITIYEINLTKSHKNAKTWEVGVYQFLFF